MVTRTIQDSGVTKTQRSSVLMWLVLGLIVLGILWSGYNYYSTSKQLAVLTDPNIAAEASRKQTEEVLGKIGKLMILPKDKKPVVATINDVEKLSTTQDFYREAHNGDRLVIFPASKKAIIYDEDDNRIVNVGPIVYNSPEAEAKVSQDAERLNIEIRNGTTNTGAGLSLRDRLRENGTYNIVTVSKSQKTDYPSTILIDQTNGAKASLVSQLQKELGATVVTSLPDGEGATSSEILIIVGAR